LAGEGPIDLPHLGLSAVPAAVAPRAEARVAVSQGAEAATEGAEDEERRARLVSALKEHQGNVQAVAQSFRTSRSQIHRWLKRFQLAAKDFRS
jgi:transcriptional regulator of acetoin/glycerol metabolism